METAQDALIIEKDSIIYETKRLFLRGLCKQDINDGYFHWFNDQKVCEYNSHGLFPNTKGKMEKYLNALEDTNDKLVWAIVEKESNKHIGNISLLEINWINRNAEFAIIVGEKKYWGQGYAYEAAKVLLEHSFAKLNLKRIYCGTAATNEGMQKLAVKLSMKKEGTRRKHLYLNGRYIDLVEYGLLREEFNQQ